MKTKPQTSKPPDDIQPSTNTSLTALVEPTANTRTTEKVDLRDLKRKSVRGGAVTLLSQAVSTAVHLASTVILARMLTPADYGIIAMVTAITSFAGLFRDLGLSSAAIQKKDLTSGQQTNLFWLNVAMGAAITILVATCSPLVSWFYGKPELTAVTIALSFNFVIGSFGAQHGAMLVRNMQFGRKAIAGISAGVLSLIVAVTMAINGFSYWALVVSSLAGSLISTTLLCILSPFWPGLPSASHGVWKMVVFGSHVTLSGIFNYLARTSDNILIGKFCGAEALGIYSRAYALLVFPLTLITRPLDAVVFRTLSQLQNDSVSFRNFAIKIVRLVAFLTMPIVCLSALMSDHIILLALGENWLDAVPIFSILAIPAFFQSTLTIRGQVMLSLGFSSRLAVWSIMKGAATTIGFLIGLNWGVEGVAASYAVSNIVLMYPSLWYTLRGTPFGVSDYFTSIKTSVLACVSSSIAVLIFRYLSHPEVSALPFNSVYFEMSFFMISYGMLALWSRSNREDLTLLYYSLTGNPGINVNR
ncbi:lipopolysaccharide biosynthesis protein [Planctomycetaceae bacterium SH139]